MRPAIQKISAILVIGFMGISFGCRSVGEEIPRKALKLIAKFARERGISVKELRRNPELRRKVFDEFKKDSKLRAEIKRMIEERGSAGKGSRPDYEVIVRNNLFRPLGYRQRKKGPSYTLLGTVIAERGGRSKALIYDNNAHKTYYVSEGERIGDATVERIERGKVTLKIISGEINLKMPEIGFLASRGGRRRPSKGGRPGEGKPSREFKPPPPRFPEGGPPPPPPSPGFLSPEEKRTVEEVGGPRPVPVLLNRVP